MEGLERIVMAHPYFAGMEAKLGAVVAGCARNLRFEAGQYLFHEGDPATELYLIRQGSVAMEILLPARPALVFQTAREGGIVGASWLIPPFRWRFDARAVELTRAIGIDARCLRDKCDADPSLGYEVMKRFLPIVVNLLDETRLQLLDVYGRSDKAPSSRS